jgi:hypothetical protein
MKTNLIKFFFAVLSAAAFALLSSCSNTTEAGKPGIYPHAIAAGNTFTYKVSDYDADGNPSDSSGRSETDVVDSLLAYAGENNIAKLTGAADTIHFRYNSDSTMLDYQDPVPIVSGAAIPGIWVRHNFDTNSVVIYDSTTSTVISGGAATVRISIAKKYRGKETYMVGAEQFLCDKMEKAVTVVVKIASFGVTATTTVTSVSAYSPKIGYYAHKETKSESDSPNSPIPNGTVVRDLISYSLK